MLSFLFFIIVLYYNRAEVDVNHVSYVITASGHFWRSEQKDTTVLSGVKLVITNCCLG